MEVNGHIVAIILAAGFSSRMEAFKPLPPLGGTPMIEKTIGSFFQAGLEDVRVVIGYRAGEIIPVLIRLGVLPIVNEDYPSGMYSSIQAGVRTLKKKDVAFFLLPGDIPLIRPETLTEMVLVFFKENVGILYPTFKGRRGHPPLVSALYRDHILSEEPAGGLKSLLASHEGEAMEIEVDDGGILIDLDTPQDYRSVLECHQVMEVPTEENCLFLLSWHKVPDQVVAHSRVVSTLALNIAIGLKERGKNLDLGLISAAGLLHDVAKGRTCHEKEGVEIIKAWGYPRVAAIVASHMDIVFRDDGSLGEREILYLADKLIEGVRYIPLEQRLRICLERFAGDEDVSRAIRRRFTNANLIKTRIESLLRKPIETLWNLEGAETPTVWKALSST